MTELLTAAQMQAIEQAAIDSGQVTGLELMERAGQGVVDAIFEEWPQLEEGERRAVVLCGPGNNGGDGFVVARLLNERGWDVEVFLYGDPKKLPPDARVNYERWEEVGDVAPLSLPDPTAAEVAHLESVASSTVGRPGPDVTVDAIFGAGLSRPIEALAAALGTIQVAYPADSDPWWPRVVSIDVPSGVCADSGRVLGGENGVAVGAHLTVTFHNLKRAHHLSQGEECSRKVKCASLGIFVENPRPERLALAQLHGVESPGPGVGPGIRRHLVWLETREWLHPDMWKPNSHKYAHGHALIISGGLGKTGAARLAARGALRIGAGLVTIACPQSALAEVAAQTTAIMCRALDGAPGLTEALEDKRLNALCLGPGLGLGPDTQHLVLAALKANRATVLDADALTRFERNPDVLFEALHQNAVLTPHAGEFKRLFPDIAAKLDAPATKGPAYSKVDATRAAAKRAGCTILFKGPDTVIADPDGRASINSSAYERSAPWLATAGSGDVLAGFITGLLARGFAPHYAAATGAWLHTECALAFGPGLIAEDLPEVLPSVFRSLDVS